MSIERYQHLKTTLEKIPLLAEKLEEQKEQLRKKIQAHRDELKGVEKKFQTLMTKEEQLFYDEEKKSLEQFTDVRYKSMSPKKRLAKEKNLYTRF